MRVLKLLPLIIVLPLISSTMVQAGFWSSLLKFGGKSSEKDAAKKAIFDEEKKIVQQTAQPTEKETVKKSTQQAAETDGKKVQTYSEQKAAQLKKNAEKGALFEKLVGRGICSQNKCFYTSGELADNMKLIAEQNRPFGRINVKKEPSTHFFIVGGENTKKYIHDFTGIRTFKREPDFLEVTVDHSGAPKSVKIWDAKASEAAIGEGQKLEYLELCNQLHLKTASCQVEYYMPENEAKAAAESGEGIFTIGCILMDPTPFGLVACLLIS